MVFLRLTDLLYASAQKLQFPSEFQANLRRDLGISARFLKDSNSWEA